MFEINALNLLLVYLISIPISFLYVFFIYSGNKSLGLNTTRKSINYSIFASCLPIINTTFATLAVVVISMFIAAIPSLLILYIKDYISKFLGKYYNKSKPLDKDKVWPD